MHDVYGAGNISKVSNIFDLSPLFVRSTSIETLVLGLFCALPLPSCPFLLLFALQKMVPGLLNVLFRNVAKVAKVIAFDELRKKWSIIRNNPPAGDSRIGNDAEKVPCDDKWRARMNWRLHPT